MATRKKKPKTGRIKVECEYDLAKAIKVVGFMVPVQGHPGRWIIQIDTSHEQIHPSSVQPKG